MRPSLRRLALPATTDASEKHQRDDRRIEQVQEDIPKGFEALGAGAGHLADDRTDRDGADQYQCKPPLS